MTHDEFIPLKVLIDLDTAKELLESIFIQIDKGDERAFVEKNLSRFNWGTFESYDTFIEENLGYVHNAVISVAKLLVEQAKKRDDAEGHEGVRGGKFFCTIMADIYGGSK